MKLGNILDAVAKTVDAYAETEKAKNAVQVEIQKETAKKAIEAKFNEQTYRAEHPELAIQEDAVKKYQAGQNDPSMQIPNKPMAAPQLPPGGGTGTAPAGITPQPNAQPMPGSVPQGQPVAPSGTPAPDGQQFDTSEYMGKFLRQPQMNPESGKMGAPSPLQIYSTLAQIKKASENPANKIKWDKGNEDMLRAAGEKAGVMTKAATNAAMSAPIQMQEGENQEQLRARIKKSDPQYYQYLEQVKDGRLPIMGRFGMAANKITEDVNSLFPGEYDPTKYGARESTRKGFSSGKESQQIRSLNMATYHLDEYTNLIPQLDNGKFRKWNSFANYMRGEVSDPIIGKMRVIRGYLSGELANIAKTSGATDPEIQNAKESLDSASSKEAMMEAAKEAVRVMKGKQTSLQDQWDNTFNLPGDQKFNVISPKAQSIFNKLLPEDDWGGPLPSSLKPGESTTYGGAKITARE